MNPVGEWNRGRVVAKGSKVTHYLNGKKIISFDRKSDAYKQAWQQSKFKDSKPMFGDVKEGHILIQDHVDEVSLRALRRAIPGLKTIFGVLICDGSKSSVVAAPVDPIP